MPVVEWAPVAASIDAQISPDDVLIIADVCQAGLLAHHPTRGEIIGASASGIMALRAHAPSLTRALIDKLNALNSANITAVTLHRQLTDDVVRATSAAPYYQCVQNNRCSVLFQRMPTATTETRNLQGSISYKPPGGSTYVVIKVLLSDAATVPNKHQWSEWLSGTMPPGIWDIEVTYGFKTDSHAYFVRMPLELWHWLPSRDAYEFVSMMKRGETLVPRAELTKENIKPGFTPSSTPRSQSRGSAGPSSQIGFPFLPKQLR